MRNLLLALADREGLWFGVLVDDEDRLVASAFSKNPRLVRNHLTMLSRKMQNHPLRKGSHKLADEMSMLYEGKQLHTRVPLDSDNVSEFRMKVYKVLGAIPRGRVTSYGQIARTIGSGPRAVGNAVGSNPWTLFVPCHRVVPADRTVGNYSMVNDHSHGDSSVKRGLLEREGVPFQTDRVAATALWNPL